MVQAFHEGRMPVTWEFRDPVLVVTLVGEYAFEEPVRAVTEAMSSSQFHAGISLLVDARQSEARRSSEELRARTYWMASLVPHGISRRFAIVICPKPHHYGFARLAGIHLDLQNMTLEIFADFEEAMRWLAMNTALNEVRDRQLSTLSGLLPVCMVCKKIRSTEGDWVQLERYISDHSRAEFTHSLCPECSDAYARTL